jgi:hypothetical protein
MGGTYSTDGRGEKPYQIFAEKAEERWSPRRSKLGWKDKMKMDLEALGYESVLDSSAWVQGRVASTDAHDHQPSGSIKRRISWWAKQLSASQEGLCAKESVNSSLVGTLHDCSRCCGSTASDDSVSTTPCSVICKSVHQFHFLTANDVFCFFKGQNFHCILQDLGGISEYKIITEENVIFTLKFTCFLCKNYAEIVFFNPSAYFNSEIM